MWWSVLSRGWGTPELPSLEKGLSTTLLHSFFLKKQILLWLGGFYLSDGGIEQLGKKPPEPEIIQNCVHSVALCMFLPLFVHCNTV